MIRRVGNMSSKRDEKKSGFVYRKRTASQVKEHAEQRGGSFDSYLKPNIDMYRPKGGDNAIRILPPTWDDPDHYGYTVFIHGYVGADQSSYLCLNKNAGGGGGCPICAASAEAKAAGEEDEAKALQPSKRYLTWIIDRNDDNPHPIVYSMSWTIDRDIAALCTNKKTGSVILIDHPDEGYDVSFSRQGEGLKTRYVGMQIDREPSPISDDEKEQDEWIEYIQENPLPSILKFHDASHLEKIIQGTAPSKDEDLDDEDEGDENEKPSRRSSSHSSRRASAEKDESGEEDEKERPSRRRSRDEDEPEEKPRRSSRRGKEEPEEEDEPEEPRSRRKRRDDDDEEEEPKSTRKRKRDEEEGPEEKPEEKPRGRRSSRDEEEEEKPRSRTRPAKDEEEDEPEEEEEVEEEEEEEERKPRRASSRSRR